MKAPRKGRSIKDIAPERLARLNSAQASTTTLVECLAVDFASLMRTALPDMDSSAIKTMAGAKNTGITRRMALAAELTHDRMGMSARDMLQSHPCDLVRGWACFMIGLDLEKTLEDRLIAIAPLADDPHFGVREWAWLALRPHIAEDPEKSIALLTGWTASPSERMRRFASEATRPRGVWCSHITLLRREPQLALPLLTPLRTDTSAYVQDSVGNWLNDVARDHPAWVSALCASWRNDMPPTSHIPKRALRSITISG